jgi:hypothetical protein
MSVAYYVVLDVQEPDFDTFVNGKAVARASDELDRLCDMNELPRLDSFMGQSIDEFSDLLGEELELPEGNDGEAKWFEPSDGIALIESIVSAIKRSPDSVSSADAVFDELVVF